MSFRAVHLASHRAALGAWFADQWFQVGSAVIRRSSVARMCETPSGVRLVLRDGSAVDWDASADRVSMFSLVYEALVVAGGRDPVPPVVLEAEGIFALWKVLPAFSGALMQAYDTTTTGTKDVFPGSVAPYYVDEAALETWLAGHDAFCNYIYNQGTGNYTLDLFTTGYVAQAGELLQRASGLPYVDFFQGRAFNSAPGSVLNPAGATDFTVIAVVEFDAGGSQYVLYGAGSDEVQMGYDSSTSKFFFYDQNPTVRAAVHLDNPHDPTDGVMSFVGSSATGTGMFWWNGEASPSGPQAGWEVSQLGTAFFHRLSTMATKAASGLFIWRRALSDTERMSVERWLGRDHGYQIVGG